MQLSVTTRHALKAKRAAIGKLKTEIPKNANGLLYQAEKRTVEIMQVYPAKRPNQTYVRTFLFQKSWKIVPLINSSGWKITNSAPGRQYVVVKQAWMHIGRWKVFRDTLISQLNKIGNPLRESIRVSGKKLGLTK